MAEDCAAASPAKVAKAKARAADWFCHANDRRRLFRGYPTGAVLLNASVARGGNSAARHAFLSVGTRSPGVAGSYQEHWRRAWRFWPDRTASPQRNLLLRCRQ